MKKIEELTEQEAREILEFVFPGKTDLGNPKKYDYCFLELSLKPHVTEDGKGQYITFGGRSIIGILYHNGQDKCILHFDNSKAVLWFYKNEYDILELLESNKYLSEMESDFERFSDAIHWLINLPEILKERGKADKFDLDYVMKELKNKLDKYYFKDYE